MKPKQIKIIIMFLQTCYRRIYFHVLITFFLGTFFVSGLPSITSAENAPPIETDCPRLVLDETATVSALSENTISQQNSHPLFKAISHLWLGKNIPEANVTLIQEFKRLRGEDQILTPEIADDKFKWQMRIWLRIYGLFNSHNGWFPGRLEPATESVFHELFWNYALAKSTVDRANQKFIWFIQGSENHDLMDLSNAFLALEALQKIPQYAKRRLRDEHTISEHVKAWTEYYCRYADERVARGLLIECGSSIYGKYSIPELVNMSDFAGNSVLRRKMTMFLDVIWADWAVEQIGGIRGGGKSRVYQGEYSRLGHRDSYLNMSNVLLGRGKWSKGKHKHTNSAYVYCLAMSRYRLLSVVAKLATNRLGHPYVSISRRPGKMTGIAKLPNNQPHTSFYVMDPADTRAVRYTYCSSEYIMGSWWVDPALGVSSAILEGHDKKNSTSYAAIHAQNRWQGIIFRGDFNKRIYPQCSSTKVDKRNAQYSVTYHQQIAVQHKNLMIVQANLKRKRIQSMQVYFAPSIREGLIKHKGWLVAKVGNVFVATAAVDSNAKFVSGEWKRENFFQLDDRTAPVIMVTSGDHQSQSIDEFKSYLDAIEMSASGHVLTVRFRDADDLPTELKFDCTQQTLPSVNGQMINLNPEKVFDCPYLKSKFGSGIVTIGQGDDAYVWNMNDNSIRKKTVQQQR
jgi:hypothetical protein